MSDDDDGGAGRAALVPPAEADGGMPAEAGGGAAAIHAEEIEEIEEGFVLHFAGDVAGAEIDGEAVLLGGDGAVHRLNPTATLVWRCADGHATLAEIIDDLAAAFTGAERTTVAGDVMQVVRDFVRLGLLNGVRAEPAPDPAGGHASNHHPGEGGDGGS